MSGVFGPWRVVYGGSASLLLLGTGSCVSVPGVDWASLRIRKGEPFLVAKAIGHAGFGSASHPSLCLLGGNRIMTTYYLAGDATAKGVSVVDWPAYSDDGGKTWRHGDPYRWVGCRPEGVAAEIRAGEAFEYNLGFCYGVVRRKGVPRLAQEMWCRTKVVEGETRYFAEALVSPDGVHWDGPVEIPYRLPAEVLVSGAGVLVLSRRAVELSDGRYLLAAYGMFRGDERARSVLLASETSGMSWEYVTTIARGEDAPWGNEGPCEPSLVLLPDGELLCVMRTGCDIQNHTRSDDMLEARSRDGGKTWSLRRMRLQGVMPQLLVMSHGVLVCAYGRPGNQLSLSLDGGRHWGRTVTLTGPDISTSGYVDIEEIEPGRLLAVYDTYGVPPALRWWWEPPPVANAVWGVWVDVRYHRRPSTRTRGSGGALLPPARKAWQPGDASGDGGPNEDASRRVSGVAAEPVVSSFAAANISATRLTEERTVSW